uniref:Uncharacterized protein n=1 Tax=Amphimedon queenslandica TaxID=400682 RepID=A0A1X7UTG8_AMPQE
MHPFQYPSCQLDTKFSSDWCFRLLKQKFRKAEVDSLDDFVQVVEQSSAVNKAQPVEIEARKVVDGPVTQFNLLKEDAEIMEDKLLNILPPRVCQVKANGTFMKR